MTLPTPVARAISHFQHLRTVSNKDLFADVDVNEFFDRPLERMFSLNHPTDIYFGYSILFSIYDDKLRNYYNVFGRDNVLVITNEDLLADPERTMRRVFDHCGLSWFSSELFGVKRYLSGSERIALDPKVRERLRQLFFPSYARFRQMAGLGS